MEKLFSAFLYLGVYSWTIIVTKIAEKKDNGLKKKSVFGVLLFAIIPPCILAGVRDASVGTDTALYATNLMKYALSAHDFSELLIIDRTYTESGYQLLAFLTSRMFESLGMLLFFTQLFIMIPFVYAVFLLRKDMSMTKNMALFMFCYYHISLNLMRQSIAMSFIFLAAVIFINKKKKIVPILLIVLAAFFHKLTILIAPILFIIWAFRKFYSRRKGRAVVVGATLLAMSMLNVFITYLLPKIFIGDFSKFLKYISGEQGVGIVAIITSPVFLLQIVIFLLACFSYKKAIDERDDCDDTLYIYSVLTVAFLFLQAFITYSNRLACFIYPFYYAFVSKNFGYRLRIFNKRDKNLIFYILIFLYWLFSCMLSGSTSTAIYKFSF